ncbi:MAG: purine-binding chemotaxis protein CheW [Clostridia bacterium]|nr:purine-binding chemotaxis protein CheW [Clostridia bacterium]
MADKQIVLFGLNNEDYGLDINKVQEIVRYQEVKKLPETIDYILGVINLRDKIIPIIDLKYKLYQQVSEITEDTRIIVVKIAETLAGVIADNVYEVLLIPEENIEDAPRILGHSVGIAGIGKLEDRLITLLELDNLLSADDLRQVDQVV